MSRKQLSCVRTRVALGCGAAMVALAAWSLAASQVHAAKVLEFEMGQRLTFGFPSGPPIVATANGDGVTGIDGFTSTLYDDAPGALVPRDTRGNGFADPNGVPKYVVGLPSPPSPLPPGWDNAALRTHGQNRANILAEAGDNIQFQSDFSVLVRIYREAEGPGFQRRFILGSAPKGNNGWSIYMDDAAGNPAHIAKLDVALGSGGGLSGPPASELGVFGGNGPELLNNTWYDVGFSFQGTSGDANPDTLKVYLNGAQIGSFVGNALFNAAPFGATLNIGSDTFNQSGFAGLYERITFWNETLDAATFQSLSIPEPSSFVLAGMALVVGGAYWRRQQRRETSK